MIIQLVHLDVAVLAGQVQRRGAVVVAPVDVGAVADEQRHEATVAVQRRHVQRREAVHVAAVDAQRAGRRDGQLQQEVEGERDRGEVNGVGEGGGGRGHLSVSALRPSGWERRWDTGTAGGRGAGLLLEAAPLPVRPRPPLRPSTPTGIAPAQTGAGTGSEKKWRVYSICVLRTRGKSVYDC